MRSRYLLAIGLSTVLACDDDEPTKPEPEAGASDAGTKSDATTKPPMDSGTNPMNPMKPLDADVIVTPPPDHDAMVARGKYITNVIYPCGSCHTPRDAPAKVFSGVDCFVGSAMGDAGCLSSRNLTNDPTGIGNLSDTEVKNAFLHGMRSDGKALFPTMPYALLGNMREDDADAIVAYLRSLPPIEHRVHANVAPYDKQPDTPAMGWPEALIPKPRADYPDQAAALRGRYLAGNFGGCMDCHTPRDMTGTPLRDKAFSGGRKFGVDAYAPNLTPDQTGIYGYTLEDIVDAIKLGEDPDQGYSKLCAPMPAGPMGAYGGMTDQDAKDIAHYLLSLAPVVNMIAGDCKPDAGM